MSDEGSGRFLRGCAVVVLAGAVLSLGAACVRLAADMSPWAYIFWRSIALVAMLSVIAVVRARRDPLRQIMELGPFGWMGALCMTTAAATFVASLSVSTIAETFFLCSMAPLIAAVLAYPVLGERIGPWTKLAVGLAMIGLYLVAGGGLTEGGSWTGRALAIVSAFAFAGYSLSTRGALAKDLDGMLIVFGLISVVVGLAGTLIVAEPLLPSRASAGYALLHGGIILAFGLFLLGQGSRDVPAVPLTMLVQTEAVLSPLWGYLFFAETPSRGAIVGGGIILAALVVQAMDRQGGPRQPPPAVPEDRRSEVR